MERSEQKRVKKQVICEIQNTVKEREAKNYVKNREKAKKLLSDYQSGLWNCFSNTELESLFEKDFECILLTLFLDNTWKNKDVFTSKKELEKYVVNLVSIGTKELSNSYYEKISKYAMVLDEPIVWLALPDDLFYEIVKETLPMVNDGEIDFDYLDVFCFFEKELFQTRPALAKKIFKEMCNNILDTFEGEDGGEPEGGGDFTYFLYALDMASELTEPLFSWDKRLYVRMLEKLMEKDETGGHVVNHLCNTSSSSINNLDDIYRKVILCALGKEHISGCLYKMYTQYEGGRERPDKKECLSDIPWVQEFILDGLVKTYQDLKEVPWDIFEITSSARLLRKSKERFLKKLLQTGLLDKIDSRSASFFSILACEWAEGTPDRVLAENILNNKMDCQEIAGYFYKCLSDDVFTEGDFFLETLLSLSGGETPNFPLSTILQSFPDSVCRLMEVLFHSANKPVQGYESLEKTLKLHQKLITGPLKNLFENLVPKESVKCKNLKHEYLVLIGILKKTQGELDENCTCETNEMVL